MSLFAITTIKASIRFQIDDKLHFIAKLIIAKAEEIAKRMIILMKMVMTIIITIMMTVVTIGLMIMMVLMMITIKMTIKDKCMIIITQNV